MIKEASRYTIAVVDDDLRVRESLETLLESEGLNVKLFPSAEAYIDDTAPKSACDCIISDVRMPGMDGTGLQRHVNAQYPDLPLILITARHDDEVSKRAIRSGAFCCLYKSLDTDALLEVLEAPSILHPIQRRPSETSIKNALGSVGNNEVLRAVVAGDSLRVHATS